MSTRKSMTASELMAKLATDPEHQRKLKEKEQQRTNLKQILAEDESELVAECNALGCSIESVWDLVNTDSSYRNVIPVLVEHLGKDHHPRIVQGIVRALTTPESRGVAFTKLASLFRRTSDGDSELKWLLGAAIAESATDSDAEIVVELANDETHGRGREFLPLGLVTSPKEIALPILEGWETEPMLAKNAKKAIKLLR